MVKITCVTENTARRGSAMWGEHGLSFWVETDQGCILFDTGQTATVLLHNLATLGKSLAKIKAVALSHAHNDHTGGLSLILSEYPGLPVYALPGLNPLRFSRSDTRCRFIGSPLPLEALRHLADMRFSAEPVEILPGVWTTGEITERPEPEGRSPTHFVLQGDDWLVDPYADDMSLVLETGDGLILVCGCCHAGLLNTLSHVTRLFKRQPVAVLGGTHLVSAQRDDLQHIIDVLRRSYKPMDFYPNHCTGEVAFTALSAAFTDRVHALPAGATLTFA
jgi:7,8-dihydropterin-6-yl-methyl-4-(beta-D-ribofuranosyl)aminobenzene 5'-phosphate synthase